MARRQCKAYGCSNQVVGGVASRYCAEHSAEARKKKRGGGVSTNMREAMLQMNSEYFVPVNEAIDPKTIAALLVRDWIIEVEGPEGRLYKITGRGRKALKATTKRTRRDGICPRCGERPRYTSKGGRRQPYCRSCMRVVGHEYRQTLNRAELGQRPCAKCHERPRHLYPNGTWAHRCEECLRESRRGIDKRNRERKVAAIRAGAPVPICITPGCNNPRHVTDHDVKRYCVDCWRLWRQKRMARRIQRRHEGVWRHGVSA